MIVIVTNNYKYARHYKHEHFATRTDVRIVTHVDQLLGLGDFEYVVVPDPTCQWQPHVLRQLDILKKMNHAKPLPGTEETSG